MFAEMKRLKTEKLEKLGVKVVKDEPGVEEFEWIKLNQTLADHRGEGMMESSKEKFLRKFQENPLVPIGAFMTVGCLLMGLGKFARKDTHGSQMMMRGRIAAQGFTVFAMLAGVVIQIKKNTK